MGDYLSGGDDDDDFYYLDDGQDYSDEEIDPTLIKRSSCKVITKESLLAAQKEDLRRVMDFLTLSEHHARTLLIYCCWDVEKLLSILVERGKDQLFIEAGVTIVERNNVASLRSSSMAACDICMEDVPSNEVTPMDCGHFFCNNCWTEHFIVQINEGKSRRIRCMGYKCNTICDEAVIRNLVNRRDGALAEKFERFLLESYIEDNKMVKWCPSVPHCGNAIRVENDVYYEVECTCGVQFCFNCLSDAHSPCSCMMWKLWMKKCEDESETANWMSAHTKPCPKCYKPVEKNGGCNLVRCVCGQYFCWLCAGATGLSHTWTSIDGHSCGRYKEDYEKKAELAKRELYRYMHYYNRYKAHMDSLNLEKNLEITVKDRISFLEHNGSYRDFSWIGKGLYRLSRSRQVIAQSYAFAFYMFWSELCKDQIPSKERELKKNLFEDQQQQFEENVEKLSKFLEAIGAEESEKKVMELRMQVINLSVTTDTMCKSMYDCIENDLQVHNIAPYISDGIEKAIALQNF